MVEKYRKNESCERRAGEKNGVSGGNFWSFFEKSMILGQNPKKWSDFQFVHNF